VITRILILAAFVLASGQGVASDDEDTIQFVDNWFALIDEGEFESAWDELAATSQNEWKKDYWLFSLGYVHEQIGNIIFRLLSESRVEHDSAGNISFVVLTFQSSYASMNQAIEIVRIGKEDGSWKVITYELENPATDPPLEPYPSKDACEASFVLEGIRPFVDHNSEPVMLLTEFLNGVATRKFSEVERFNIIADQASLNEWRNPQCFTLSKVVDVRGVYSDNSCCTNTDLAIEVLEKRPDHVSYYSLKNKNGEWSIVGWRAESAFEACLSHLQ